MIFTLVVAVTVGIVYLASLIPVLNKAVGLKTEAIFDAQQDDRGTALAAFLKSGTVSKSYAEILGEQTAEGADKKDADIIIATLNKMDPHGKVEVWSGSTLKSEYNKVGDVYLSADIALPGGQKGEVRVA